MRKVFEGIGNLTTKRPKLVLTICLILTIIMGYFATELTMDLSWVSLAPKNHPSVHEYQKVINDFPSMSNIMIVVSVEDSNDMDKAVSLVEERLSKLDKYVSSVVSGIDSEFLIKNGLILSKEEDIEATSMFLSNPNMVDFFRNMNMGFKYEIDQLNNSNEIEKLTENEDYIASNLRGFNYFFNSLSNSLNNEMNLEDGINSLILGDPYIRSIDGKKVLISVQPKFDILDYELLTPGIKAIEEELKAIEKELHGVKYGLTGMHVVGRDEMQSVESDSYITTVIGILFILLLLYFAFRLFSAPLLAFIPLVIGVIWDIGLTALIIGRLNLITAFTAIMLIGLGIDFSIHILSGYTEARSNGKDSKDAIYYTLIEIGSSIFVGAMTTAAAFLSLNISSLQVLSELGFVMGTGILTTVVAVFFILPSILVLIKGKEQKMKSIKGEYNSIGKIAKFNNKYRIVISITLIIIAIFMGYRGSLNSFDLNMLNLEPKGIESVNIMKEIESDFGMSTEGILVSKDNLEDIYKLELELKKEESVATVNSVADILPSEEIQKKRIEKIKEVRSFIQYQPSYTKIKKEELVKELEKFSTNIKKLGNIYSKSESKTIKYATNELNSTVTYIENIIKDIQNNEISNEKLNKVGYEFYNKISKLSEDMFTGNMITVSNLPQNFKMQYVSEDEGHYLLMVYPNFEMWENLGKDKGEQFLNMAREKDPGFTGTPVFMRVLYESAKNEIVKSGIIVFSILLLILMLHFKSIKYTIISFIPLLLTLILTVGTMEIIGLKWNILNVLALPLIIGIGIDDSVHVLHRYTTTNDSINNVFSSVGRAILITSLTTMAGFGSLIFSSYRGMAQMGAVLFIGVGYAFLMTLLVIPTFMKDR